MLNEYPDHLSLDKISKLPQKKANLTYTSKIVRLLTTEKVADLIMSFFLDMAGKELGMTDGLNQTEQFGVVGNKLISMYLYILYSRSLINIPKTDHLTLSN